MFKDVPKTGEQEDFPAYVIGQMDKHDGWAVIICLIGGGQEINEGEDGVIEWIKSIKTKFPHWGVHLPREFVSSTYLGSVSSEELFDGVNKQFKDELHLKTSARSFRTKHFSKFVNHLLDRECQTDVQPHPHNSLNESYARLESMKIG